MPVSKLDAVDGVQHHRATSVAVTATVTVIVLHLVTVAVMFQCNVPVCFVF